MITIFVVVKDGKTVNLKNNRLIFDFDKEPHGFTNTDKAGLLADGVYNILAIDLCMQHDDNDAGRWILTSDEQYAMQYGWPTRMVYYYWKDERVWRDKPHPSVELANPLFQPDLSEGRHGAAFANKLPIPTPSIKDAYNNLIKDGDWLNVQQDIICQVKAIGDVLYFAPYQKIERLDSYFRQDYFKVVSDIDLTPVTDSLEV